MICNFNYYFDMYEKKRKRKSVSVHPPPTHTHTPYRELPLAEASSHHRTYRNMPLSHTQISVVADLPVGQNLQDHLFYEYSIGVNRTVSAPQSVQESLWTRMQLKLFGSGLLIYLTLSYISPQPCSNVIILSYLRLVMSCCFCCFFLPWDRILPK